MDLIQHTSRSVHSPRMMSGSSEFRQCFAHSRYPRSTRASLEPHEALHTVGTAAANYLGYQGPAGCW